MDNLPCPGCRTPLPPEASGCSICLRPRSKQEIMRGYSQLKAEKSRRRIRPFKIAAAILVLGAGAKLYWEHRTELSAAVERWFEGITDPSRYAKNPSPDPASAEQPQAQDASAPSASAPPATAPPAPKSAPSNTDWRVRGTVYDLATLKPVPGAAVVFSRDDRTTVRTTTGLDGRYETDLLRHEGWSVSVKAENHRNGQIVDIDPPYRTRDADARRAAVEQLADDDLLSSPVRWSRKRSLVTLDLVVVPDRWTGAPEP